MLAMPCHAETASAEMSVSVLVPSGVNVNVEPIIFNLGNAGAGSAVSMLQLEFDAPVTPPMITFGSGGNDLGDQRQMSDGNGNFISYSLMQSGVLLTRETEIAVTQVSPRSYQVVIAAVVDPMPGAPVGTYSDIVTVTIGFSP